MNEIYQFGISLLQFIINILTLFFIGGIFYVIGLAVLSMARNQQPKWQNIAYTLVILAVGVALLRWYPPQVVGSIRIALESARPEATLLQAELQQWLPQAPQSLPTIPSETTVPPTETPLPADTAVSTSLPQTAVPLPTYTPYPTYTPPPTGAPCTVTINGSTYPCAPTPELTRLP